MVRPKGRGNAGSRLCIVGLRRLLTKRCFFLHDSIDYVAFVGLFLVTPGIKITGRGKAGAKGCKKKLHVSPVFLLIPGLRGTSDSPSLR